MGLTGQGLLVLLAVVAAGCVAATVWVWPRLARRHWTAVLGRLGTLVATQLAALAALGVAGNDYFGFYASWDDLLGTGGGQPVAVQDHFRAAAGGRPQDPSGTATGVDHLGTLPAGGPGGPRQSGLLEHVRISGGASGISSDGYVYLPPQYFRPQEAHRRLPAAVVLTGYPGDARNLVTRLDYPGTELREVQAGRMRPTVLVMLRPTVAPPRDTECVDVPGGPQAETYFTRDVPRAVAAAYRVASGPRSWGVIGDSTGGYCALSLTLRHPDAYGAAVSLSGYYRAAHDPTTGDLFHGSARLHQGHDLMWRLRHLPAPDVPVLVTTSRQGEADYRATRAFIAAARPPLRVSSITLPSGGHNFHTWKLEIPVALPWLAEHLRGD
ncbi:alpha/beta hydrolase [Streptomyces sp. NPDC001380]|uniref:alpha/beta hydrolase n=1 Tax=Streptomyces sp. NPDC001380 TaxID=3364566 RepID=UPI0036C71FFE